LKIIWSPEAADDFESAVTYLVGVNPAAARRLVASVLGLIEWLAVACIAPLVDDAEVRQFVQNAAAGAVAMVEGRFRDGISGGEIPSDFPVAARASQVIDLLNGLTMRAKMGVARKTLLRDAEEAADLVLLPRGASHGATDGAQKPRAARG